jgi:hypothetical protein
LSDREDKTQRCVVFQIATGWRSTEEKRMRLFIYIHELGHCLNLRHPWENTRTVSLNGYSTLSWMNYPWRYYSSDKSSSSDDFWESFCFQFTDLELMHLRHAFRDYIYSAN